MFTQANLIKQEFRKHTLPSCQLTHLFIICHACLLLSRSVGCGVRALKRMQPCVAVVVIVVTAEIHLTHVCHIGAKGPAQSVCQLLPELRTWLCRVPPRWEPVQPWRLWGGSTEAFMLFNYRCSHNTSSTFYCSSSTEQEITTKPWHCHQVEMFGNSSAFTVIGTNVDNRWLIVIHEPICDFSLFFNWLSH